jgi:hypothetical protein
LELGRRSFIKAGGALALLGLLPRQRVLDLLAAPRVGQAGHYLNAHQLDTLRALTARLIPGPNDGPGPLNLPPGSPDPGAVEGMCAEAIDILLGAFSFDPPMIHAGGPFSNRHGSSHDDFADFVALDQHAELGWRIRVEGSQGIPAREFAGPVTGLQQVYTEGLAHLDAVAQSRFGVDFVAATSVQQDAIIINPADSETQAFVGTAFSNTIDAMYGPPEYGGNQGLVGWQYTHFSGDVQPQGFTDVEVTTLDTGGSPPLPLAAARNIHNLLPGMGGRAAPRQAPWLARPGFRRG